MQYRRMKADNEDSEKARVSGEETEIKKYSGGKL